MDGSENHGHSSKASRGDDHRSVNLAVRCMDINNLLPVQDGRESESVWPALSIAGIPCSITSQIDYLLHVYLSITEECMNT
jgi:hypothetical protein